MNPSVDRSLVHRGMDNIDHALGRPVDPMRPTWRNHFASDGAEAEEMANSFYWEGGVRNGDVRLFRVTLAGRQALAEHLKAIGDHHRAFVVTFDGHETNIAAETPGKAKYLYWLKISDCMSDMTFGLFCRHVRVRGAG